MDTPQEFPDLRNLQIIGYASSLDETMLPMVVPPVFQDIGEPGHVFVPPYTMDGNSLCNATRINEMEWQRLVVAEDVTPIERPIPARRAHEMWVGQNLELHYEPVETADKNLRAIALEHLELAEEALKRNDLDEADRLASVALAADDRIGGPMIVKGAVYHLRGEPADVRVMAMLAEDLMTPAAFEIAIKALASTAAPTAVPRQNDSISRCGTMAGMACLR